jgi:hypothetical protein
MGNEAEQLLVYFCIVPAWQNSPPLPACANWVSGMVFLSLFFPF